jgi:deoxyribodipyrimidine photolyase
MAGLEEKIGVFMETGNEQVTRELRQLKITLHERKGTLGQIDEHILDLLCGNKDVSDEEISAETEDAGRFNAKMLNATLAIETALNTTVKPTETVPTTSSTPSTSQVENTESVTQEANMAEASEQIQQQVPQVEATATVSVNEQVSGVKLPKLEIKKFDGNLAKWREFWDSYECAIHKNDKLSEIDKFSYLRGLLEGQASTEIAGFALTGVNYKEAVDLL